MARQGIYLGQIVRRYIMDRVGQSVFPVEGGSRFEAVGIVIHTVIRHVDLVITDQTVTSPAVNEYVVRIQL